jgi:hypothetical protein
MKTVQAHVGEMEAELKSWGARLDGLVAKTDAAGTSASTAYRTLIDDLKGKYQAAQSKLAELQAAGSDRWETYRSGLESAWNELETAFKKV